ncbi:MAG: hypothetical protein PCFJNLEI_03448 [Verrucomicrobiae bacterium]|nr:hypothetical protein [Verrucomicrobiae bacterium]
MEDRVIIGLTVLWGIGAVISLVIHVCIICPRLYRNGAHFPTGLLPWRILSDMHRYKELCRAASDSLSPYYIYMLILWFTIGFGIFVGLLHLWQQTKPL